jgi:hypothetical protein
VVSILVARADFCFAAVTPSARFHEKEAPGMRKLGFLLLMEANSFHLLVASLLVWQGDNICWL